MGFKEKLELAFNFEKSGFFSYAFLFVIFTLVLFVVDLILSKRNQVYFSLGSILLYFLFVYLYPTNKALLILFFVLEILIFLGSLVILIVHEKEYQTLLSKTREFLDESNHDYVIQMDTKGRIREVSHTVFTYCKKPRRDIYHKNAWEFIFNTWKISKIDKTPFSIEAESNFIQKEKLSSSKHKNYLTTFTLDTSKENNLDEMMIDVFIQPIYFRNHLLGKTIYLFENKMRLFEKREQSLAQAIERIEKMKNQQLLLENLSDRTILYFDYFTKTYVATSSFCEFTKTSKNEYTFDELYENIYPEDRENYIEQAKTVSSLLVTKIKYRLKINEEYYYVIEDSIYQQKESDLISVIHVLYKVGETVDSSIPLSTQEMQDTLNELTKKDITGLLDSTEEMLDGTKEKEHNS